METTINRRRTREEIIAWWQRAKERKIAWEEKMQAKWAEEDRQRREAAERHYYDLEWE
jgi:hypothetical protein